MPMVHPSGGYQNPAMYPLDEYWFGNKYPGVSDEKWFAYEVPANVDLREFVLSVYDLKWRLGAGKNDK
jgi:hypothetical protein